MEWNPERLIFGCILGQPPSLPGCISEGETRDEALANIREAIELYLEPVEDDLSSIPGVEVIEIAI